MSTFATLQIQHSGIAQSSVPNCQIDNMSQHEAAYFGGSEPYQRYYIFLPQTVSVLQDDLLVDPASGKAYRVINDPESYPNGHIEVVADKYRGS